MPLAITEKYYIKYYHICQQKISCFSNNIYNKAMSARSLSLPGFFFIRISPSTLTTGTPLIISTLPSIQFSKISTFAEYIIFPVPSSQCEAANPAAPQSFDFLRHA
jgi:hypothetical protein